MKKKENIFLIVAGIMAVAIIILFVRLNGLSNEIKMLKTDSMNMQNRLDQKISSIYNNVDEKMRQQASLFSAKSFTYGELNVDEKKANVHISLTPKTVNKKTRVEVVCGNEKLFLERGENNEFSGIMPVSIFLSDSTELVANIIEGSETKIEQLGADVSRLYERYIPKLSGGFSGSSSYTYKGDKDGVLNISGKVNLKVDMPKSNNICSFKSITLETYINGKKTESEDITEKIDKKFFESMNSDTEIDFVKNYNLKQFDVLEIFAVAEDSMGFVHKVLVKNWQRNEKGIEAEEAAALRSGAAYGREVIYNSEGKMLVQN